MSSSDPLDTWLRDSISRGCTLDSMVESMVTSGHVEHLALLIVTAAFARFKPEVLDLAQESDNGQKILRVFRGDITLDNSLGNSLDNSLDNALPAEKNYGDAAEIETDSAFDQAPPHITLPPTPLDPSTIVGNVVHLSDRAVSVGLVCTTPRIALFDNVFSETECADLIAASRGRLERSKVVASRQPDEFIDDTRTSYGGYFNKHENSLVTTLQRRIAELVQWPLSHAEPLQILNYAIGGEYLPHFDYFEPAKAGEPTPLTHGGQRIATVVIYLNDVEAGGGTLFPRLNLETRPKKGSALFFSYQLPNGAVDPLTLHGGSPVLRGEKWIATQWFREQPFS